MFPPYPFSQSLPLPLPLHLQVPFCLGDFGNVFLSELKFHSGILRNKDFSFKINVTYPDGILIGKLCQNQIQVLFNFDYLVSGVS